MHSAAGTRSGSASGVALKKRAFTLLEVMVGSGVLLVMVVLASMATISYLRGYAHYTKEGAKLRLAAKTLESLTFELRSARAFKAIPRSIRRASLEFEDTRRRQCSLQFRGEELWVVREPDSVRLGQVADVNLVAEDGLLKISVPVPGQAPVHTAISLRGVAR